MGFSQPPRSGRAGLKTVRSLIVTSKLPAGIDFVGASDRGTHRSGNMVEWRIDPFNPGDARTLIDQNPEVAKRIFALMIPLGDTQNSNALAKVKFVCAVIVVLKEDPAVVLDTDMTTCK